VAPVFWSFPPGPPKPVGVPPPPYQNLSSLFPFDPHLDLRCMLRWFFFSFLLGKKNPKYTTSLISSPFSLIVLKIFVFATLTPPTLNLYQPGPYIFRILMAVQTSPFSLLIAPLNRFWYSFVTDWKSKSTRFHTPFSRCSLSLFFVHHHPLLRPSVFPIVLPQRISLMPSNGGFFPFFGSYPPLFPRRAERRGLASFLVFSRRSQESLNVPRWIFPCRPLTFPPPATDPFFGNKDLCRDEISVHFLFLYLQQPWVFWGPSSFPFPFKYQFPIRQAMVLS